MKVAVKAFFRSSRWQWLLVPASAAGAYVYAAVLNKAYPIRDWLLWQLGDVWCGTLLFNVGAAFLGYLLLTRAFRCRELPLIETAATSFAVGLVALTWLLALAGSAGLFRPWVSVSIAAVAAVAGGFSVFADFPARKKEMLGGTRGRIAGAAAAAGVCATFLIYLLVLTPESLSDEATSVYLLAAQDYFRTGMWGPFVTDLRRGMPELASLLYTWGFLWPGLDAPLRWTHALHLEFSCFLWTLSGVAAAARWMLAEAEVPSTWSVLFLFPVAFVYNDNLGGGAGQVLAVFAAPTFLATVRLLERFDRSRAALLGLLLGGALFTKYQGVYLVIGNGALLFGAWVARRIAMFRRRGEGKPLRLAPWTAARVPLVLSATALAVLAPYFVKNWHYYGSPLYPLTADGAHDVASLWRDPASASSGPARASLANGLRLGLTWPFEVHNGAMRKVPMLGSVFVLLSPFALVVRGRRRIWSATAVVYAATVSWALAYVFDRDLQMLVPLMAAVVAAVIVRTWSLGTLARMAVVPVVALQLIWNGDALFYFGKTRIMASTSLISSGYGKRAAQRFNYRTSQINASEQLPENARVLCHAERRLLGFDHDLMFDSPLTQSTVRYDGIRSVRGLYEYYKSLAVTHLLWPQTVPSEHSKQAEVLFAELVGGYVKVRKPSGNFRYASMPAKPPPEGSNDPILVLGTSYQNGFYRLEQLTAVETTGARLPAPVQAVDVHAGLAKAAQSAAAVVVSTNRDSVPLDDIKRYQRLAMRYADHDIYVRERTARRRRK